jgi:hypothetical protein
MAYSRRHPGPSCSPFSGAALSKATGLVSVLGSCESQAATSSAIPSFVILSFLLVAVAASSAMLSALVPTEAATVATFFDVFFDVYANQTFTDVTLPLLFLTSAIAKGRRPMVGVDTPAVVMIQGRANILYGANILHGANHLCRANIPYGGEANESIRFMMDDEQPEAPPISEAAELWLAQVEEEKRQIEALDVVRRVYFTHGESFNDNKAWVSLSCCWQASRRSFKSISVNCHETLRPSQLENLKQLHADVLKTHACSTHKHDERAVQQQAESGGEVVENGFDRMRLAQAAQQLAQVQVVADEKAAAKANDAYMAAALQLKASKAKAAALAPPSVSHKKQKNALGSSPSVCACACPYTYDMHVHAYARQGM